MSCKLLIMHKVKELKILIRRFLHALYYIHTGMSETKTMSTCEIIHGCIKDVRL
jgi:hypothetical protein